MEEKQRTCSQLRRIGQPATISTVKDIMKLSRSVTRFGRHSKNEYFLDSASLQFLISRWHAEIHRADRGETSDFILLDKSLNGTFVNDYRVKGNHVLKDGDIVTFGHRNGRNIKPGQLSEPFDTEFKFIFESVVEETDDEEETEVITIEPDSPGIPIDTTVIREDALRSSQETPTAEVPNNLTSRRLLHDNNSSTLVLKDISNSPKCKAGTGRLVNLDQLIDRNPIHCQPPVPLGEDIVTHDHLYNSTDEELFQVAITVAEKVEESTSDDEFLQAVPIDAISESSCITTTDSAAGRTNITLPSEPTSPVDIATAAALPSDNTDISMVTPKQGTTGKKGLQRTSQSKPTRKVTGRKKRKSKSVGHKAKRHKSLPDNDSDYHEDGDKCDSYDCCQPTNQQVSWVQCDDCDRWFHTVCAGCSYEAVKNSDAEFHCGCI